MYPDDRDLGEEELSEEDRLEIAKAVARMRALQKAKPINLPDEFPDEPSGVLLGSGLFSTDDPPENEDEDEIEPEQDEPTKPG